MQRLPRLTLEIVLVVVTIALAGWVNLPMPLHGDAALYQLGAKALSEGEMIYRDFWDLKQPGIYLFHWLGGSLFGFTERGLHLFELLYMIAFAVLQLIVIRRYLSSQWLAPAVPLLTVGGYYALSTEWHLTQPAMLLSAPLFCVLALLTAPAARWRSVVAGGAGAVAILFKFAVAPVVACLFVAGWLIDRNAQGKSAAKLWRDRLLPAALGAAAVSGALLLWLHRHDALQPFIWVFQTWAPLALEVRGGHPIDRVVYSSVWFGHTFAPEFLLAAMAWAGWRGVALERVFVLAAVWLVVGTASIIAEPFAGWQFDFLMLAAPLAVLAVRGVDGILAASSVLIAPRQRVAIATLVLGVAAIPAGIAWTDKARSHATHRHLTNSSDKAYQRAVSPHYEQIWQSTAFLREEGAVAGPIYVFGDPLIHVLSERASASSIHGWAWELQPPVVWQRLEGELVARPPAFIFAEPEYDALLSKRSPVLRAMLDEEYEVSTVSALGTWYVRRDPEVVRVSVSGLQHSR